MREIFFLSIQSEYVQMILNGNKKWEFRQNPDFGILPDAQLSVGDNIFIVSVSNNLNIPCFCVVNKILRGNDFINYFKDFESYHWKEAGYIEGSKHDWEYFNKNILNIYKTAIEIIPYPINPPINIIDIKHDSEKKSWKGIGFTPAKDLKRYSINGEKVISYFERLSNK